MILVYPIGIPAFYFLVLYQRRKRLNPGYWAGKENRTIMTEEDAVQARSEDPKNDKLMFLVETYKCRYWWWEVVEALRRLAFTGALAIFGSGSFAQLFFGMWLCIGMMFVYLIFQPYVHKNDERLAITAQMQVYLVIMSSILYSVTAANGDLISAYLIITFMLVIVVGVGNFLWHILLHAETEDKTAFARVVRSLRKSSYSPFQRSFEMTRTNPSAGPEPPRETMHDELRMSSGLTLEPEETKFQQVETTNPLYGHGNKRPSKQQASPASG